MKDGTYKAVNASIINEQHMGSEQMERLLYYDG